MTSYPLIIKSCPLFVLMIILCCLCCPTTITCGNISSGMSTHKHNNISNGIHFCVAKERKALLRFKDAIEFDSCDVLTSWGDNEDCCQWRGVGCSSRTGHVIKLDLHGDIYIRCLEGNLSPSLVELKHLQYLDLSFNYFQGQSIPTFIGSLTNLNHLNLSNAGFFGEIPRQLANLSRLTSLDLSTRSLDVPKSSSLQWLSHLTLLRYIDLSGTDLSEVGDWFQIISNLPFLTVLKMDRCQLISPTIPSLQLSQVNSSTTLQLLSLAENYFNTIYLTFQLLFNSSLISNFGTLKSLSYLDLSYNQLQGRIPDVVGKMHSLSFLNLSYNQLQGRIPHAIGKMHSLSFLDLSGNKLQGRIPDTVGKMHSLSSLILRGNQLAGSIPNSIGNLKSIEFLDLSDNLITGPIPSNFASLHSLSFLDLSYNQFQSQILEVVGKINSLSSLNLSYNQLQGRIPDAVGKINTLLHLDLSNNQLEGTIPDSIENLKSLESLNLSYNLLSGMIPDSLSRLTSLDLSYNNFGGVIPPDLCRFGPSIFAKNNTKLCSKCGEGAFVRCPQDENSIWTSPGIYVSIGLGFYIGFWGVCGTLFLKNSWRYAFFRFLDNLTNQVYVTIVVCFNRVRRNLSNVNPTSN